MNEEIPEALPPLTAKEELIISKLSEADIQLIDATILTKCSERWSKVARVIGSTIDTIQSRYPGLPWAFYGRRVSQLADDGRLESQGNLSYVRFSEVRLPSESRSDDDT